MRLIRYLPAFSLPFCLAFATLAQTPPRHDTQFWNETQMIAPINKKAELVLSGGLRFGREISRPVDERLGVGIAFKPNRHFTIQPHYLYIAQQPSAGRKVFEHRLNLDVTGRIFPGRFTISDRTRIERRVRLSSRDFTVWRNRLQIEHPARLGSFKFKPFVANEVFYDSSASRWTRNRFSIGCSKEFSPRFTGEFYYLRQNDGRARPGNLHVIGTAFRIRLRN